MNEFELRSSLRQLRREREPERDLWSGIESRLAAQASVRQPLHSRWPWALAASIALAALGLALSLPQLRAPESVEDRNALAVYPLSPVLEREARGMAASYEAALSELQRQPLPMSLRPAARELDASLAQIQLAMQQDPQSRLLLEQMRRTYESRLRLSQRAVMS